MSSRTDLLVRISELYYQQNLSQQDISKITGISRPTISRLLDEAKETGVVEIIVHSPINKIRSFRTLFVRPSVYAMRSSLPEIMNSTSP
ncbi:MAG: MarR family transcriptional regulator [Butyricicoccus sp.]